jgi:hypothetical protein
MSLLWKLMAQQRTLNAVEFGYALKKEPGQRANAGPVKRGARFRWHHSTEKKSATGRSQVAQAGEVGTALPKNLCVVHARRVPGSSFAAAPGSAASTSTAGVVRIACALPRSTYQRTAGCSCSQAMPVNSSTVGQCGAGTGDCPVAQL